MGQDALDRRPAPASVFDLTRRSRRQRPSGRRLMHNRPRCVLLFAATLALVISAMPASAQTWPQRPVRFLVTLGPGSGIDIGTRLVADRLSARWGQPVVVENRPGGDGLV